MNQITGETDSPKVITSKNNPYDVFTNVMYISFDRCKHYGAVISILYPAVENIHVLYVVFWYTPMHSNTHLV
jgi:prepilin signal peptidase PulO-like enzyme (type II secretory pathway)